MAGLVGLLLLGNAAHADRIAQANNIFTDHCARCHSSEKLRPKASQEQAPPPPVVSSKGRAVKSAPDPLRDWFEQSHANDAATHCHANKLDPVQRELVLSFLRKPNNPRARMWAMPPRIAARNAGNAPVHKKIDVPAGQGDHR